MPKWLPSTFSAMPSKAIGTTPSLQENKRRRDAIISYRILSLAAAYVKGFRMPASHCARGCTEAGVRKASKEETAGGVCAGGSVGLWGFNARFCATWPLSDGTAG